MVVQMSNQEIARRWFEEGWGGNWELVYDTFIAQPIVDGKVYDLEFVAGNYRGTIESFTGLKTTVEQLLEQGDWVVIRYRMDGTHEKTWRGIAPSGQAVSVPGISMARFENGKIVELWDRFDVFGLLLQINAIPMPFQM